MPTTATVILDSKNPYNGSRLTTLHLRYPRFIHAEFMTHRVFSRNASSSRAIPIKTFLKQVWNSPATPIHWGANQPGMKARKELYGFKKSFTKATWSLTGKMVCAMVWLANKVASPHKQTLNRLLEPWQYISVVVTATEWENFFHLRNHPDAQPEIKELAEKMIEAMNNSAPEIRWVHAPYTTEEEYKKYEEDTATLLKLSTARCARVSYLTHEGKKPVIEKDLQLHDMLVDSVPIHASPSEHPAIPRDTTDFIKNFRAWQQYRVEVEKRNITNHK